MIAKYERYAKDIYDFILNRIYASTDIEEIYSDVYDQFNVEIILPDGSAEMQKEFIMQLISLAHRAVTEFKGEIYDR